LNQILHRIAFASEPVVLLKIEATQILFTERDLSKVTFDDTIRYEIPYVTLIIILMASIEINFSIMSHHGSTDREARVSPQELDEDGENEHDVNCQPRNLVQNRMYPSIQSESSVPNNPFIGAFGESDASMSYPFTATAVTRHTPFGMSDHATRNIENAETIRHDPSSELLGSGLNFENRGFLAVEPTCPSSSSALINDSTSFEIENYEKLAEDLRLNPLTDVNEPAGDFSLTHSFEENKDSLIDPQRIHHHRENDVSDGTVSAMIPNFYEKHYIFSLYAHGYCAPQRYDEDVDRKPAAIDSMLFQQQQQHQQYYCPNQQSICPTQASNNALSFDQTTDRSLQDQATAEKKIDERKTPPVASDARGSDRSPHDKGKRKSNLKAPPVACLLARGNRRSSRITTQTIKNKVSPKKALSKVVKSKRSKTRSGSKIKAAAPQNRTSTLIRPTKKQINEARTRRKTEALLTWFKRLQELVEFKDDNGHGKNFHIYSCSP
jgi:hypothetical protein